MKGVANIVFIVALFVFFSCSSVKHLRDNESLLVNNHFNDSIGKSLKIKHSEYIFQNPNTLSLGLRLKLHMYNLAKPNPDSTFTAWLKKAPKRESRLDKLMSHKQVENLKHTYSGINKTIKQMGEPPVVFDSIKTDKSVENLKFYYKSIGFLAPKIDYEVHSKKEKEVDVTYRIDAGKRYVIDSIYRTIEHPYLDSLYAVNRKKSYLKKGDYHTIANLELERTRLSNLFRNSGVSNFQKDAINYVIYADTTSVGKDKKIILELSIKKTKDSQYLKQRVDKVNVYIRRSNTTTKLDSLNYKGLTLFYQGKLRYRPKIIYNAITIKKDSVYRDEDRVNSYAQLSNFRAFSYPTIDYKATSPKSLTVGVTIPPKQRYTLQTEAGVLNSPIQNLGLSGSLSYMVYNIFRGAEVLEISTRGNFGYQWSSVNLTQSYKVLYEFGGDIALHFPRIVMPFDTQKIIPTKMLPETKISIGSSFQKNIGLDKQRLGATFQYIWHPKKGKDLTLDILNVQYLRNLNNQNFFVAYTSSYNALDIIAQNHKQNIDPSFFSGNNLTLPSGANAFIKSIINATPQDLKNYGFGTDELRTLANTIYRLNRLTSDNFIMGSAFTYTLSDRADYSDNTFYRFFSKLELSGNLLSLLGKGLIEFKKNEEGNNLFFGVEYSQYAKLDVDVTKYWELKKRHVIATRWFTGLVLPYGNSNYVPFLKSYFAGGTNDNRGWIAYSLGPGNRNYSNDYNDANFKIALNFEYRFPLIGGLNGALFTDVGNIWYTPNRSSNFLDGEVFSGISSLKNIAVSTGLGFRYDFSFLVLRLDLGLKTYNPALAPDRRFLSEFSLGEVTYNIGINYPF